MLKTRKQQYITMNQQQLTQITKVLRENPRGMTVTQISKEIGLNRNSVAKYLEVLLISGHAEMRTYGPAKVFSLSQRVPISSLLNFSSDYIIILDRDFKIIQINDNFLNLTNTEREAILEQRIADIPSLPLFCTSKMTANLNSVISGKTITQEMECPIGEETFWFNIKLIPITFEDGLPGVTIILENITEHKRFEDELRASEQRYRLLLESITDGIYVVDHEFKLVLVNNAGANLLQMSKEKLLGKKVAELPPDAKETPFFKAFERMMETRKPDTVIGKHIYEDGRKGWYEVRMYPVPDGFLGIVSDITERKNAEEELVLLSNAVKMSTDSIVITDVNAKIVDANEATLKMYGAKDKTELIGKSSFDLIAPENREKVLAVMKEVREQGRQQIQEFKVITREGAKKTIELSIGIMKDDDDKPKGYVAISRIVPEHKN